MLLYYDILIYCIVCICTVNDLYHHVILEKRLHNQTVQSFSLRQVIIASGWHSCNFTDGEVCDINIKMENDGHGCVSKVWYESLPIWQDKLMDGFECLNP